MKTTTTLFQNPCNKIKLKNNPQIAKAKINILKLFGRFVKIECREKKKCYKKKEN